MRHGKFACQASFFLVVFALAGMAWAADFTHGPILGRLGADRVGVGVRTSRAAPFHIIYGEAPDKLNKVSATSRTKLNADNTGWVLITGLKSQTRYYYRAVLD